MKTCSKCKVERPRSEFFKEKRSADGLMSHCKFCRNAAKKALRDKNPGYWMKWQHGITKEQFDAALDAQGGKCPICDQSSEEWQIDHDHSCCSGKVSCEKCFRGIICRRCNWRLGWYERNRDRLTAYLNK